MRLSVRICHTYAIGCLRPFSTCSTLSSGHNRWSKIKHDKGKADGVKNKQRSSLAKELAHTSKCELILQTEYRRNFVADGCLDLGADPNMNSRLASLIASAKKAGFPQASIDAAIARGQGRSTNGAALESVTIEAMLPNAIAAVIECQTDSKARLLQDIRDFFKHHGATMTPTTYLFERKGKILLQPSEAVSTDELLEHAIEVGALDVETEQDGTIIVLTEPNMTSTVAEALSLRLGLKTQSTELVWQPKTDAMVEVGSPEMADRLTKFTSACFPMTPHIIFSNMIFQASLRMMQAFRGYI